MDIILIIKYILVGLCGGLIGASIGVILSRLKTMERRTRITNQLLNMLEHDISDLKNDLKSIKDNDNWDS